MNNFIKLTLNQLNLRQLQQLAHEFNRPIRQTKVTQLQVLLKNKYIQTGGFLDENTKIDIIKDLKITLPNESLINKLEKLEAFLMIPEEISQKKVTIDDYLEEQEINLTPDQWVDALIFITPPFEFIPSFLANYLKFDTLLCPTSECKVSEKFWKKLALVAIITDNVNLLKKVNLKGTEPLFKTYNQISFAKKINAVNIIEYLHTCKYGEGYEILKRISATTFNKDISDISIWDDKSENFIKPTSDQLNSVVVYCNKIKLLDPDHSWRPNIDIDVEPQKYITVRDILMPILQSNSKRTDQYHYFFEGIVWAHDPYYTEYSNYDTNVFISNWGS